MKKEKRTQENPTGLLGLFQNFLETIQNMEQKGFHEQVNQGTTVGPMGSNIRYSYHVRVGSLGLRPGSQTRYGNARKPTKLLEVPEEKNKEETLVDVFEGKKKVHVIMELPGVQSEKNVDVELKGRDLRVKAQSITGLLEKTIPMPQTATRIKSHKFKNGILEVIVEKRGGKK
ncbi:MAG: Hsp20/alpha crystallin family protein [bacterium]|nr:Hsp20/alpha crystallin family protein [bacterium]